MTQQSRTIAECFVNEKHCEFANRETACCFLLNSLKHRISLTMSSWKMSMRLYSWNRCKHTWKRGRPAKKQQRHADEKQIHTVHLKRTKTETTTTQDIFLHNSRTVCQFVQREYVQIPVTDGAQQTLQIDDEKVHEIDMKLRYLSPEKQTSERQ